MTSRKDIERQLRQQNVLMGLGFTRRQAADLRRISMALHRWYELECGTDRGCIERDPETDKPFYRDSSGVLSRPVPDREKGAKKRLADIIRNRNDRVCPYPSNPPMYLSTYLQTDPRGAALYIIRPGDIPEGEPAESFYIRGICVY